MKKIRLGIYIDDEEYGDRLTCYFMNHFNNRLLELINDGIEKEVNAILKLLDEGDANV